MKQPLDEILACLQRIEALLKQVIIDEQPILPWTPEDKKVILARHTRSAHDGRG